MRAFLCLSQRFWFSMESLFSVFKIIANIATLRKIETKKNSLNMQKWNFEAFCRICLNCSTAPNYPASKKKHTRNTSNTIKKIMSSFDQHLVEGAQAPWMGAPHKNPPPARNWIWQNVINSSLQFFTMSIIFFCFFYLLTIRFDHFFHQFLYPLSLGYFWYFIKYPDL